VVIPIPTGFVKPKAKRSALPQEPDEQQEQAEIQ
jgi:hypothetical protein